MSNERKKQYPTYSVKVREIKFSISTDIIEQSRPIAPITGFFNIPLNPPLVNISENKSNKCCFYKLNACCK